MKQKKKPWMLLMKEVKILVSPLEMSSTNVCTCPSRLKNDQVWLQSHLIIWASNNIFRWSLPLQVLVETAPTWLRSRLPSCRSYLRCRPTSSLSSLSVYPQLAVLPFYFRHFGLASTPAPVFSADQLGSTGRICHRSAIRGNSSKMKIYFSNFWAQTCLNFLLLGWLNSSVGTRVSKLADRGGGLCSRYIDLSFWTN